MKLDEFRMHIEQRSYICPPPSQAPPPQTFSNHSNQSSTQIRKRKVHKLEVKLKESW